MFYYITREGKPIYLAELCFFENSETPYLRLKNDYYLATSKEENSELPAVSYIFINAKGKVRKEKWTILPTAVRIQDKPKKILRISIDREFLSKLLKLNRKEEN